MLETKNLLDVKSVFASAFCDPVDQHRDFRHGRIHPVEREFEWQRHFPESFRPIQFDLTVLDLLRASDNFCQPLALYGCGYAVVRWLLR
jgi:hypothetical protein